MALAPMTMIVPILASILDAIITTIQLQRLRQMTSPIGLLGPSSSESFSLPAVLSVYTNQNKHKIKVKWKL